MNCPKCGAKVEKKWSYCPDCGLSFGQQEPFSMGNLDDVFRELERMAQQMERGMRMPMRNVEVLDLTPFFQSMKRGGFTIQINQSGGKPPQVNIQTFGDVDRRRLEEQIQRRMGVKPKVSAPAVQAVSKAAAQAKQVQRVETNAQFAKAKVTKEPSAEIRRLGDRLLVDISLPGVKHEKDIDINELEYSVEVKALAGDTGYFKILTKPEQFSLARSRFSDGKLHLEFA